MVVYFHIKCVEKTEEFVIIFINYPSHGEMLRVAPDMATVAVRILHNDILCIKLLLNLHNIYHSGCKFVYIYQAIGLSLRTYNNRKWPQLSSST